MVLVHEQTYRRDTKNVIFTEDKWLRKPCGGWVGAGEERPGSEEKWGKISAYTQLKFSFEAAGVPELEFSVAEISFTEGKAIVFLYEYREAPMIDGTNVKFINRDKIFNVRLSEEISGNYNVTVF